MTGMIARVVDVTDAGLAASGGVDMIEVALAVSADGMPLDPTGVRAIRAAFPGVMRLRLDTAAWRAGALDAAHGFGAEEIALPRATIPEASRLAKARGATNALLVAVVTTDEDFVAPLADLARLVGSVMLDGPVGGRLIDSASMAQLDALATACRALGLPFGFAGGLESPDVARLLVLAPDLLGFDLALRRDHRVDRGLDPEAIEAIRALIPRWHEPRGGDLARTGETDHIFVHDFVAYLSIGAYQAERGVRQRVRFSVDADVRRPAEPPTDMRGVFSYDIIIETIRVLAERPHVTFVETLAEEVAAALLTYPQIKQVSVKVEKLDVIEGSVGIVIRRDRTMAAKGSGQT